MNKRPEDALLRSKSLNARKAGILLSPDQLAELDRCLSDDEPFATEEETRAVFDRLTK